MTPHHSLSPPIVEYALPSCLHFGICGGCQLQHLSMQTQLANKQYDLLTQLQQIAGLMPQYLLPPLSADSLGYRRKARLSVKFVYKKNKLLVGFREKSSRYVADIKRCDILYPQIGERLLDLSQLILSLEDYRYIPQIEIASGDQESALVFRHLESLKMSDKKKLINFGKKNDFHIYLQPNPPASVYKIWPEDTCERLTYSLPDYQLEFSFHPLDFTQIHLAINRMMVKQVIHLLDLKKNETILDLFCGIGNFTLPIARFARHVTGIEGNEEMVKRAEENAKHNNISNVDFYCIDLQKSFIQNHHFKSQYDKILLDPPRSGAQELLIYFDLFKAKKIVYVSCNPTTLARDAKELVHQHHFQLKSVGIINMFPHTAHVEAVAVFEKQ